ncbi:MAG: hypothetical protein WA821_09765 [Anaerolineales bacterium]
MSIEFNDKGKYFTDVISKVAIPAIIQTVIHRIEGFIHVRVDERVKNELDRSEAFLAVTDAKVFAPDGSVLYQVAFISIARSQIVWVIPSSTNPVGDNQ